MFGKITRQHVKHHFNRAKDFLGNAYHQSRKVLGNMSLRHFIRYLRRRETPVARHE